MIDPAERDVCDHAIVRQHTDLPRHLGAHIRALTVAREVAFGLFDAGVALHRQPAQQADDCAAVSLAHEVPGKVADEAAENDGKKNQGQVEPMGCGEGAGCDQERSAGNGNAYLTRFGID